MYDIIAARYRKQTKKTKERDTRQGEHDGDTSRKKRKKNNPEPHRNTARRGPPPAPTAVIGAHHRALHGAITPLMVTDRAVDSHLTAQTLV